jgi:hypothetical protein
MLGGFCTFAARENIRLRWRARVNGAGTRYRIVLNVDLARHVCHEWSDVFPIDRPLAEALDFVAGKYHPFYADLIARQRRADLALVRSVAL